MVEVLEFLKQAVLESERKVEVYTRPIKRHLYDSISVKPNLHIIYGLRGGGKTTLLFQKFLEYPKGKRIYITADELKLLKLSLYDIFKNISFIMDTNEGAVFIDEITALPNWDEELKVGYDAHPKLHVYVSGSSMAALLTSKKALARRAKYHHLLPMTFREYVRITKKIELKQLNLFASDFYTEILRYDIYFREKIKENPIELVGEYMLKSQPFLLESDETMLKDLVDKIIYDDIAKVYRFGSEILDKFERLLFLLAMSEKITYENISQDLKVSKGQVGEMLKALLRSGIVKQVLPYGSGRVVGRKTWRYFFVVPAIRRYYMKKGGADESRIKGYTKEDLFVSHLEDVFYQPSGPDFVYKGIPFEIGGKNKTFEQMKKKEKGFVVYDGMEIMREGEVIKLPFYLFLSHL